MQIFQSNGIEIAFMDEGEGVPILLIHGFGSNATINWVQTGWTKLLLEHGFRVIAIDNRGHGQSEKLHDSSYYPARLMAEDAARLIEHLNVQPCHVMGYSMGARICAFLAISRPELISTVIFGGLGINMIKGTGDPQPIIEALMAPSLDDVAHPVGRMFRQFGEATGSDLKALAACMGSSREKISADQISQLQKPVLIAVGEHDEVAGSPDELAELMPNSVAHTIPRRDHMRATGDNSFKEAAIQFLNKNNALG